MAWALYVTILIAVAVLPGMSGKMLDLGMTEHQLYLLVSIGLLGAFVSGIPGGLVGDRLGVRRTVALGGILGGLACLLRAFFPDYTALALLTFLVGATDGIILPNLPKMIGEWFPPEEHGMATGISVSGIGIGVSLPYAFGAYFPSWQLGFLTTGALAVALGFVWFFVAREPPKTGATEREGFFSWKRVSYAARNRTILLLFVANFLFLAAFHSVAGSLKAALIVAKRAGAEVAGFAPFLMIIATIPGNLFWPSLSDRIGRVKPVLGTSAIAGGACIYSAWESLLEPAGWIFLGIGGFFLGAVFPLLMSLPPRLPEFSREHVATASGLILTGGRLGGFVILPFLFSPIALGYGYSWGYLLVGVLIASIAAVTLPMMEVGRKK